MSVSVSAATNAPTTTTTMTAAQKKSNSLGACNFCRKMHSSCEGRPKCNNCIIRGIECVFMEKKKPGPPLGYKKRKNTNSTSPNASGTTATEKKVRKNDATAAKVVPTMEKLPSDPSYAINGRASVSLPVNKAPTVTIRPNPLPASAAAPLPMYQGPIPNAVQPPPSYPMEYYLKDPSTMYPYGRPLFPEMSLSTGSPGSPFSMMYYSQYSPECIYSPQPEMSLPASPSSFSPQPPTIPASPRTSSFPNSPMPASPTTPATPSSSSASSDLERKEESPGLEITLPAMRRSRVDPDRFLATAATYAQYMDVFQKMYKDDALGIFTFVDIPPLEYIFPLAGMSREGKLFQIVLFTVLGLGALGSGDQKQSLCLGESAFRLADDYIQEERQKRKSALTKKEMQQECIAFLLLSVIDHANGNFTRVPQIARYIMDLSTELLADTNVRSLDLTTGWMVAHINAKSKFLFPREERIRRVQHFLACLPSADPGVRLFTMFSGVLDQILEVCCLCTDLSASDFGWIQSLVNQAEDLLVYLNTVPPYGESHFRKSYTAIFSAIRAVMLYLTGCYNSASTMATNATHQLIECTAESCPIFFGVPLTLALVAKIHCFNNNSDMLQVCLRALREIEPRFPSIKHFYVGLEIPTVDNLSTGWFPDLRVLVNRLRAEASTLRLGDKNLPDLLTPSSPITEVVAAPQPKSIMSYMDTIFECDWL